MGFPFDKIYYFIFDIINTKNERQTDRWLLNIKQTNFHVFQASYLIVCDTFFGIMKSSFSQSAKI